MEIWKAPQVTQVEAASELGAFPLFNKQLHLWPSLIFLRDLAILYMENNLELIHQYFMILKQTHVKLERRAIKILLVNLEFCFVVLLEQRI